MKEILKDPVLFFMALSMVIACTSLGNSLITAVVYVITVVLIFVRDGHKPFINRSVSLYLGFVAIAIIYAAFGKGTLSSVSFRMRTFSFISMMSAFVMSYHLKTLNSKQITGLMKVAFVAILFSVIGTTAVSFIDPMAVRIYGFGGVEDMDFEIANRYRSMGMMGYSLAHAFSVVAVGLSILALRAPNKWLKIISVVLLALTIRLLFIMTITTALLLAVIGVTIVFANYFSNGRLFVTISLTVVALVVFFLAGFASVFIDFSSNLNTEITRKFIDLFSFAETGVASGQAGYREELYMASFKTFLSNPVFGWGSDNGSRQFIGEHSYMLDYLAYYGAFASLLFISWYREYFHFKPLLSKRFRSDYVFSFIPVVGLCAMKGYSVCGSLPFMSLILVQLFFLYLMNSVKKV